MLFKLNDANLYHILLYYKSINILNNNLHISKHIYNLIINDYNILHFNIYINILLYRWKRYSSNSYILTSLKNILYVNNIITLNEYNIIDINSVSRFNISMMLLLNTIYYYHVTHFLWINLVRIKLTNKQKKIISYIYIHYYHNYI